MGTGHVMRMIALAHAWQDCGGEAVFLCAEITPALEARLKEEGFLLEKFEASPGSREDLEATCAAIAFYGADSIPVALDGYQFDADFQLGLKKAGCRLLVMDDFGHAGFYHADWVLNQNISGREEIYARRAPHTRLLLGTKFALIRREFLKYRGWQRQFPETAGKVLVTLGGSDPDNVTGKVIEALAPFDITVKVVVGGSNPHVLKLKQTIEKMKTQPAKIELVINPTDMPGLMAWADLAVAAGGSTAWELAFMGLPSLFVILADNQVGIATELESAGFGVCIGRGVDFEKEEFQIASKQILENPIQRHSASIAGNDLVDGMGCHRTVSQLNRNISICLRPVSNSDIALLWEWANDPVTRKNSFDTAEISWIEHSAWCQKKLSDADCRLLIAINGGTVPVGCVRFDCKAAEATISITVAPSARGKGYGAKIIQQACYCLFANSSIRQVHAYIKPDNIASVKVFEAAGFRYYANAVCKEQLGRHYTLQAKI